VENVHYSKYYKSRDYLKWLVTPKEATSDDAASFLALIGNTSCMQYDHGK
jgi:hypothetical protein